MTAVSGSLLANSKTNRLRRFKVQAFKDASASDTSQVPAGSASVNAYKQGASVKTGGTFGDGAGGTITCHDIGRVKKGDTVFVGVDTTIFRTVDSVTTETIVCAAGNGSFDFSGSGARIRVLSPRPNAWTNQHAGGTAITWPVTTDSRGHVEFWSEEGIVDYIVSGSGLTTKGFNDLTTDFPRAEVRLADMFQGADWGEKVKAALNDLNETWGGVVDARGLIGPQEIAADPFLKESDGTAIDWPFMILVGPSVITTEVALVIGNADGQHIMGIGEGISEIVAGTTGLKMLSLGNNSARSNCSISRLTVNCADKTTVSGVRVRGAQASCHLERVHIKNAVVYALELTGALTKNFKARDLVLETNDSAAIPLYCDSTLGEGCSVDSVHIAGNASEVDGIQKNNTTSFSVSNVTGSGVANLIHVKAQGGCHVNRAVGDATIVDVVEVDAGITEVDLREILASGATYSVNDVQRSKTIATDLDLYAPALATEHGAHAGDVTGPGALNMTGGGTFGSDVNVTGDVIATGDSRFGGFVNLGSRTQTEVDLIGDVLTPTTSYHTIGAETGTADDLENITATNIGDILVLSPSAGDTITVLTTGNIILSSSSGRILNDTREQLVLRCDGTNWEELSHEHPFTSFGGWVLHDLTPGAEVSPYTLTPLVTLCQVNGYTSSEVLETITAGVDGDVVMIRREFGGGLTSLRIGETGNIRTRGTFIDIGTDDAIAGFIYDAANAIWMQMYDLLD